MPTIPNCLDEFGFRFSRRRSQPGHGVYRALELAVAHGPVLYQDLVANRPPQSTTRAIDPTWTPGGKPTVAGHRERVEFVELNGYLKQPYTASPMDALGAPSTKKLSRNSCVPRAGVQAEMPLAVSALAVVFCSPGVRACVVYVHA